MKTAVATCVLIALASAVASAQPSSAGPEPEATTLVPPSIKSSSDPEYPVQALVDRIAARVAVDLVIDTVGGIESASLAEVVLDPEDEAAAVPGDEAYGFGAAALAAAFALEFEPATENGAPVAAQIQYTFTFTLPARVAPNEPLPNAPRAGPPSQAPVAEPVVNLSGQLLERGTRARLAGLVVTVFRQREGVLEAYEATADASGRFELYDLAAGPWGVRIEPDGYYQFSTEEEVVAGRHTEVKYYLERASYNPLDVLVEADRPRKEVSRRRLSGAEAATVAGTLGDPIQVVENLPGVARSQFGTGDIIVRGSGPRDTGIFVDGVSVPLIYHFGGLKSVLPTNVVESIDFYPGNYSVEYGRALGGILDAHIKRIEPDQAHGSVDISLLDTSVYLETPITDKAAIAFAARRSYVDFVLDAVVPSDLGLGLVEAPRYYDYQVLANYRPSASHDLRLFAFGSDDRLELLFDDAADEIGPGAKSNEISAGTSFQRLSAEYRYTPNAGFKNRLKVGLGRETVDFEGFGNFILQVETLSLTVRDTATFAIGDSLKLNAGVDNVLWVSDGLVRIPRFGAEGEGGPNFSEFTRASFENEVAFVGGAFVEAEIDVGPVRVVPGLRLDYFDRTGDVTFDPRVVVRYKLDEQIALKAGVGVVHQDALVGQTNADLGNPDLEIQSGVHYSVGAEWRPAKHLSFDATLFYKTLDHLVAGSSELVMRDGELVPEVFNNDRSGRVYGAELYLRHDFSSNFRGWLSYTLSRAERLDPGESDYRLFDYDQTHILALVASYRLPRNWEVGLRFRLTTGSPFTPIAGGVFIDGDDEYEPVAGAVNSSRLPSFDQLDLRVDKRWIFDTWQLSAYLSLSNTYNAKNIEQVSYNYDFSQRGGAQGLPILPIFGLRADF